MPLTNTLFGEWDIPEDVAALDVDEAGEADDWHEEAGPWQPIATVSKTERVDLWIQIFELDGEAVANCWWNAEATIPDWYRTGQGGAPELAAPIFAYGSHWKPVGAKGAPVLDGGPGLLARVTFDDGMTETWPPGMLDRYNGYFKAVDEGLIDRRLTMRGLRTDGSVIDGEAAPGLDKSADLLSCADVHLDD
jgi:hypothetical protein